MGATDSGATDGAVKAVQSKSSGLSGSVGYKGANAPDDVWKVSSALTNNGLMDAPQSHADNALYTSITKAQENMDSTLKRDGDIGPKTTDSFRIALAEHGPNLVTKRYGEELGFS